MPAKIIDFIRRKEPPTTKDMAKKLSERLAPMLAERLCERLREKLGQREEKEKKGNK